MMNRRVFLLLMMTSLAGGFAAAGAGPALAKDGGGNSGKGGGDSDGGKDDGGKDDDGKDDDGKDDDGKDDGGKDDGGKDDDGKDDGGKDDDGKDDDGEKDDDRDSSKIRNAVKRGEAESLGKILPNVRRKYPGKVINIRLTGRGSNLTYRIRLISRDNKLMEIRVDAQSGKIIGMNKV